MEGYNVVVGFIGLGAMGFPMAGRMAAKEVPICVWNRSQEKGLDFQKSYPKAKVAANVEDVLKEAELIFVSLSDYSAVKSALLSENTKKLFGKKVIAQTSTISPAQNLELKEIISTNGGIFLECPVQGNSVMVAAGKLILMMGGPKEIVDKFTPIFSMIGKLVHVSEVYGKASVLKLANNQIIAAQTCTFALSLAMITQNDIAPEKFMEIIRSSPFHSQYFDFKYQRMVDSQHAQPTFSNRLLLKDVNLAIEEAEKIDLDHATANGIREIIKKSVDLGYAEDDISAIIEAVKKNPKKSDVAK